MITARAYIHQADQVLVLRDRGGYLTVTCAGLVMYFDSEKHLVSWQEAIDVARYDLLHPDEPNPYGHHT